MKKTKPDRLMEELREIVRVAGLRRTASRIAVLRCLHGAAAPVSHADVAGLLAAQGFDNSTVFRNLKELAEAGILSRVELGDHVFRYEWRRERGGHDTGEHPHFLCVDCGEVSCLPDVTVNITPTPGSKRSTVSDVTEVLLKGHCDRCG